jgi:hypothetical protein
LITEFPDYERAREKCGRCGRYVATGEQAEVQNPVASWQRNAP